jgi:glycosyltransferase involved in cell wall biosynthesis
MKISVLMAACNSAPHIAEAIASVRAQTHGEWELFVVEADSRDGTEEIVRRLAASGTQPIHYENLGANQGVAATRNRLLQLAGRDAAAFLDADDFWSPDHLEHGAHALGEGADVVVTGVRTFDLASKRILNEIVPASALEFDPVRTLFLGRAIVTSSCVFLSRAIVQRIGEFDRKFRIGEDRDYWLRAALAGACFTIEPGLTCLDAKRADSTMDGRLLAAGQTVQFYEKYFRLNEVPSALRRRQLARSLLDEARLLRARDARASARQLWRAWQLKPYDLVLASHLAFSGGRAVFSRDTH